MGFYDRHIGPRLVSMACGLRMTREQREKVLPRATGTVLEIGMGSGHNLTLYDPGKIERLFGLEPDPTMRQLAAPKIRQVPFEVHLVDLAAEKIPLDDDSIDTVLTTFTLCTIPDAAQALAQMRRVLRPNGQLLFLEHGLCPEARVQRWQHRVEPRWKKLAGGCHLTRAIPTMIESAGFAIQDLETGWVSPLDKNWLPPMLRVPGYEFWGMAKAA